MPASTRELKIIFTQAGDAEKKMEGLLSKFGGVGKVAGLAAGGVALLGGAAIGAGAKLVSLGGDAFEMESKFNVVFGRGAENARAALERFGDDVGRSTYELEEMAASVQDTFVPLGFARDKAASLSLGLTQLAVDVASFNNAQDTDVMADFQSAIVGNHETVRKYGIVITQATLDQELMRMGIEDGIKAATEQEKVQARLNLIMAGTSDAQGDATKTAGSWANQMRALKSSLSEAATSAGTELLPVVLPLLQNFTEWVKDVMPKAVEIFKKFAGDLKETVGPAMLMINDAITRIAQAFGANTDEVSGTDAILWAFKKTLDAVVIGVQAAAIVMWGISKAIEGISNAIKGVIGWVDRMIDKFNAAKNALPDWMTPGSPTPLELGLRGIGDALKDVDQGFGTAFKFGGFPPAAGAMSGGASGGQPTVINFTYSPAVSMGDRYEMARVLKGLGVDIRV